jgi:long-chain acyl-CoA synthetase
MLGELLTRTAQATPDKPALIAGSREISYREFDQHTQALAHGLLDLGLRPGDRVALHMLNSIEAALSYFACFKADLIAVPSNLQLKPDEIGFALEHSQARIYVAHPTLYDRFSAVRSRLPAVERTVLVDQEPPQNEALHFDALFAHDSGRSLPPVTPDAAAVILYTSGTTARPKGVLHTHQSLWHCARLFSEAAELRSDGRMLLMCPMMHMSGLLQLLTTVFSGGTAVIVPPLDPVAALDAIERARCTHMFGLPVAYHFMVREQERAPRRVDTIRSAIGGGDSVPVALIRAFQEAFGVPIREGHGMSECAPNIANPRTGLRPGSMGRPLPGVEARVDAVSGETGELLLRTPGMFARYWRDEEETRRAFQDGFLRTGDLARIDDDGFFWFAGRSKEIIVRGAANISPQEVEDAICRHPAVAQAGVVGVPDELLFEKVVAFVSLHRQHLPSRELELKIRLHVTNRHSSVATPHEIVFVDAVPKNKSGKIMRRVLKAVTLDRDPGDITTIEDEGSVEEARQAWQEMKQAVRASS